MYIHRFLKFYKSGDVRIVVSLEATGRTCLLSHYKAIKSFFSVLFFVHRFIRAQLESIHAIKQHASGRFRVHSSNFVV